MQHLDDNRVANLAQGLLRGAELLDAENHLDGCDACRKRVSEAASALAPPTVSQRTGAVEAPPALLSQGITVGRYVVIHLLGSGGMGVVYAAFDPELDRRVALKLLRPDLRIDAGEGRSRLLREAQALAHLSHQNLLTVYDVGAFGGSVFLTMELVDGGTLRAWQREAKRPWRTVLAAYVAAGEGLAAAHATGLVHRDFKPSNVLIGNDGRVRVTDFGLVRPFTPGASGSGSPKAPPDAALTETGAFVGTPQYSSPEQLDGRPADARSDQFSFCVSLYEGLFGERPFEGETGDELRRAISAGAVRPPPTGARVPARIRRALLRGLSLAPERRFESLDALLAELRRDPARRWRRWGAAATVLLLAAGVAGRGAYLRERRHRDCVRGASLESVWGGARKAAAKRFYLAGGGADAEKAWNKLEAQLDSYARRWSQMQQEVCEAPGATGSAAVELERCKACLIERRYQLEAVADLLATNDAAARDARSRLTRSIERLEDCLPTSRPPAPVALSPAQEGVLEDVTRATAWLTVGKYKEALGIARETVEGAKRLGDPALTGRALRVLGEVEEQAGDPEGAEQHFREAIVPASAAGDDETLLELRGDLLLVEGLRLGDATAARREADEASALLARLRSPSEPAARLALHLGDALSEWGDKKAAEVQFRKAIALENGLYGPDSPEVATARMDLALNLREDGRYKEAWDEGQSAASAVDPAELSRADAAFLEKTLGFLATAAGRFEDSERSLRKALDIYQGAAEPDGQTVDALLGLGEALVELGEYAEAVRVLERVESSTVRDDATLLQAQSLQAKVAALQGDYAPALARLKELVARARPAAKERAWLLESLLLDLGTAQLHSGDVPAALQTLKEDRQVIEDEPDRNSVFLIEGELRLAGALQEAGRDGEAWPRFEKALALEEAALDADSPLLSLPLAGVGRHYLESGQPRKAAPLLERAAALAAKMPGERFDLASTRFLFAKASWDSGGDRSRASAVAAQASEGFAEGKGDARWRAEVDRWRASHPGPER